MDKNGLDRLEELCLVVYGGKASPPDILAAAHKVLLALQTRAAFLPQVTFLLSNARTPFSLLYAVNSILSIVQKDWNNISPDKQEELGPLLLNFLVTMSNGTPTFITNAAIRCYCRIVKESWAGKKNFNDLLSNVKKLLESNNDMECILGLRILANLVAEFDVTNSEHNTSKASSGSYNYRVLSRYDAKRRLLSQAFREQALGNIFVFSLRFVDKGKSSGSALLLKEALFTLLTCLKFDFVGTGQQSSEESVNCLYIPTDWAEKIARDKGLLQLFDIYRFLWTQMNGSRVSDDTVQLMKTSASYCLEMLTWLVSVRRSAFTGQTRRAFLIVLITETTKIMDSKLGLDKSEDCLHHFCRLLAAIKNHFTLVDLTQPDEYHIWLRQFTSFTTQVLQAWNTVSSRTVHYVVKLWAALVLPTPYLQARDRVQSKNSPQQPAYLRGLNEYVPEVVKTYIYTRSEVCSSSEGSGNFGNSIFNGDDEFLGEEGLLIESLVPVAVLCRFRFSQSLNEIQAVYNEALNGYNGFLSNLGNLNQETTKLFLSCQSRLTFLNYLIGTIIGSHVSRVSASVIENFDETNLELATLVFSLIHSMNQNNANVLDLALDTAFRLEMSCLYFVRSFQNLYIEARARLDSDKNRFDAGELAYGLPYPNVMYEAIRGIRGQTRGNNMDEENDSSKNENNLKQLQDGMNKRFGTSVLDMALQKVFMILSHMSTGAQIQTVAEQSNRAVLIEKALFVLHELSIGVTVVHAGRSFAPKLMSSGKLLLESKTIQTLLITPEARNFPLLSDPVHYKSRSFLMATLAKLLFTQLRNIPKTGVTLDMASFKDLGFDLDRLFAEINSIIFNNSSSLNSLKGDSSIEDKSAMQEESEVVIVSGDGLITINKIGSSLLALQNGSERSSSNHPLYAENFYQRRTVSRSEVSDILFVQFMKPLDVSFQRIGAFLNQPVKNQEMIAEMRKIILLHFRDVKGILSSCAIAKEYELFFSWLFPDKARFMAAIANLFWNDDIIMSTLFKFLKDLVHNKGSRITFGSSYNAGNIAGTMLFKEACNVLLAYVEPKLKHINEVKSKEASDRNARMNKILKNESILKDLSIITGVQEASQIMSTTTTTQQDGFLSLNALKEAVMNIESSSPSSFSINDARKGAASLNSNSLKLDFGACGVGITLDLKKLADSDPNNRLIKIIASLAQVLCRILHGRFANISSFKIYNDDTLKKTITAVLELIFIAEPYQIVSFPKMANSIVDLFQVLCGNAKFLGFVVENNPSLLARIIGTLAEVINLEVYHDNQNQGKNVSLEEVATNVAQNTEAQDSTKHKYGQYRGIVGKAAIALYNLVELRCRSVAFRYVKTNSPQQGAQPEAVFNTKLSFLSLELRNILDPEYRPSLSSNVHNNQAFTHSMLESASKYFAVLDENMPNLFSELLVLILSKLFTLTGSEPDTVSIENDSTQKPIRQRTYAARSNAKRIAKTLLPLILTTPHTFEQFKQRVSAIHVNNTTKQSIIEGRFAQLFKVLQPAITIGNGLGVGPNPAYFEALLRHNEPFAGEVCKLADELNQ